MGVDFMDDNYKWVLDQRVKRTMESLESNNMEAYYVKDEVELLKKLDRFLKSGDTVSVGGSMTLFETGIIDYLNHKDVNFLNRYKEGITPAEVQEIYRNTFFADEFFVSSNAVTEQGELYNVDGNGNRVAAMIYGPKTVIVIVGINKIVKDLESAVNRIKAISAPANAKRLNKNTPCTKVGYCMDCSSGERICNDYVLIKRQNQKGRIKVIIVGKELGY